ncbi:hypothetical protein LSAT2_011177 [Lamellibrachia satsuma]|nr:hypothetical protein LSAT2_011177 [Lamellibrachia satsuma]
MTSTAEIWRNMCHIKGIPFTLLVTVACVIGTGVPDEVTVMKTMTIECGARVYDPQTQLCCDGIVMKKHESHECCGNKLYNSKYFRCCDKHIVMKAGTNACCGTLAYHTGYDICCDGKVFLKHLQKCPSESTSTEKP